MKQLIIAAALAAICTTASAEQWSPPVYRPDANDCGNPDSQANGQFAAADCAALCRQLGIKGPEREGSQLAKCEMRLMELPSKWRKYSK